MFNWDFSIVEASPLTMLDSLISSMEYTRIIVKGRVQGVFFRVSTKEIADKLSISGFVRNLSDGSVEIIAEGNKIDELIHWCRKGPSMSKVSNMDLSKIEYKQLDRFEIRN